MDLVFDIETDGIEHTKIHCLVTKDLKTGEIGEFYGDTLSAGVNRVANARSIIGHNIISFDLPCLSQYFSEQVYKPVVIDTLVWSRTLYPNRPVPPGADSSIKTGHSLAAWGYAVGRGKPEYHEWEEFDSEMLNRCREDVEINCLTFNCLLREADLTLEEYLFL